MGDTDKAEEKGTGQSWEKKRKEGTPEAPEEPAETSGSPPPPPLPEASRPEAELGGVRARKPADPRRHPLGPPQSHSPSLSGPGFLPLDLQLPGYRARLLIEPLENREVPQLPSRQCLLRRTAPGDSLLEPPPGCRLRPGPQAQVGLSPNLQPLRCLLLATGHRGALRPEPFVLLGNVV